MNKLKEYKCPNCGAILEFNSDSQKLKCPFCDSQFEISDFIDKDESSKWDSNDQFEEYHCQSCGAEIIAESTAASLHCPYCDNPVILTGRLTGKYKPDYVIPFKIDKKAAKDALTQHFKGKIFLPKVFKDQNHLDEIKGIYVPFWLFDTDTDSTANYEMSNTRIWTDAKNEYKETKIYHGFRSGISHFEKVPIDGSEKMPNEMMESIEPFNYDGLVPFQSAYLSGYYADKYDVDSERCSARIKERIKNSTETELDSTVHGYGSIRRLSASITYSNMKVSYSLLPVWILNTTWNGNKYTFAMNGQTGKFVGNLPFDTRLVIKYYGLYSVIGGAILFLIARLLGLGM